MAVKRNESAMTPGILLFLLVVCVPLYLLMEKPVVFWFVFVPVAAVVVFLVVRRFKRR